MIMRYFGEEMMNLMSTNRVDNRMNMTIVTINGGQLPFDIVPFSI